MKSTTERKLEGLLRERYGWKTVGLVVWARASCRCEYCGNSMLDDRRSLRGYSYDHILPKSRYRHLYTEEEAKSYHGKLWLEHTGRGFSNLALCCRPCNTQKNTWDPNAIAPLVSREVEDLSHDQRVELIQRVRAKLHTRWQSDEEELAMTRAWAAEVEGESGAVSSIDEFSDT